MLLSKCAACNTKKSKFLKQQKARKLLSKFTGVKILIISDLALLNTLF